MKKVSFCLAILLLLLCQKVLSQNNDELLCAPGNSEYSARYIKLKELYVRMQNSESAKTCITLKNDFLEKSNYEDVVSRKEIIAQSYNGLNAINQWVLDNIEKTDFKSCEEAENAIKKGIAANFKIHVDNKELYSYLENTYKICPDLCVNLLLELKKEYGKDFQL